MWLGKVSAQAATFPGLWFPALSYWSLLSGLLQCTLYGVILEIHVEASAGAMCGSKNSLWAPEGPHYTSVLWTSLATIYFWAQFKVLVMHCKVLNGIPDGPPCPSRTRSSYSCWQESLLWTPLVKELQYQDPEEEPSLLQHPPFGTSYHLR